MNRSSHPHALILVGLLLAACTSEPDCSAQAGFSQARNAPDGEPACEGNDYLQAWRIGQALGELEHERAELQAREDELAPAERMRLRVLQRDIPEFETLARIEGLLEPAPADEP